MHNYDTGYGYNYDVESKIFLTKQSPCAIVRTDELSADGGPGSGNWGHAGVKGKVGGSAKGTGGKQHRLTTPSGGFTSRSQAEKENKQRSKGGGGSSGGSSSSTGSKSKNLQKGFDENGNIVSNVGETNDTQRVCGKVAPNDNLVKVTTLAGDHQVAEGKDISSTVQVKTDSKWNAFEQVAYQQGFKNPPQVVTDEDVFYEISAESNVIGFRSVNTYEKDGETITGVQSIENFKNYDAEEFKSNTGGGTVHGYGLYFATNTSLNDVVTSDVEGIAFNDAKLYAKGNDGDAIMKVTLHSSTKIVDESQLKNEFEALSLSEQNKYRKMCSDDVEAMSVYAVAKGYDGIQTTDSETAYTIVYNTSKVVVYDVNEEEY